ncbi:MAG TPA: FecR domain-containing protein [Flavitalea sp.]|nr:FecR domain-containing protein [Flavitalea sp.]
MKEERFRHLFYLYAQREASANEEEEFLQLVGDPSNKKLLKELLDEYILQKKEETRIGAEETFDILQAIFQVGKKSNEAKSNEALISTDFSSAGSTEPQVIPTAAPEFSGDTPMHKSAGRRAYLLKTAWFRYAAAILLVLGAAAYLYLRHQQQYEVAATTGAPFPTANDLAPGGNKAILTLADGSTIVLDSAAQGPIAQQEGIKLIKTAEGLLEYERVQGKKITDATISYNTIRTPRGGQYQLRLPDGTRVWLNAASSISYPTFFSEKERTVKISGEVFFDVAKDKARPFHVEANTARIDVLGTEFNINAYEDETTIKTTLLEGSLQVASYAEGNTEMKMKRQLKPGQQARAGKDGAMLVAEDIDTEAVIAWKNGYFSFDNTDLTTLMRQISRWYDVDIEYAGKVPTRKFGGEISRNSNLLQTLKILSESKIFFRIEGKKIIVLP